MFDESQETQNVDTLNSKNDGTLAPEAEAQTSSGDDQDSSQRPSDDYQERNWKALRESREAEQRRNEELRRQNAELHSMVKEIMAGKSQKPEPEEDEDDSDIPTLGQTKKAIQREAERIARNIVKQTLSERDQATAPTRLRQEHPDFSTVVNKENVDYLIKNEPEIAVMLDETKDVYKQGKIAYKFIKSLGIAKKDNVEAMKQDAYRNTAKPVSPNAVAGRNSVGDANMFAKGLTTDLKKQLHQEMLEAIKRG